VTPLFIPWNSLLVWYLLRERESGFQFGRTENQSAGILCEEDDDNFLLFLITFAEALIGAPVSPDKRALFASITPLQIARTHLVLVLLLLLSEGRNPVAKDRMEAIRPFDDITRGCGSWCRLLLLLLRPLRALTDLISRPSLLLRHLAVC
jgi:hypothetical protein